MRSFLEGFDRRRVFATCLTLSQSSSSKSESPSLSPLEKCPLLVDLDSDSANFGGAGTRFLSPLS